jgi:hypothetical protein
VIFITVSPSARAPNAAVFEKEARMEYLVGGAVFAVYLAAQLLAVIALPPRQPVAEQVREAASATPTPRLPFNRQALT